MNPFTTLWIVELRYVSSFPHSPIGACLLAAVLFLLLLSISSELPPLVQSVAKFSHANGATSQYSLKTIREPYDGKSVTTLV